MLSLTRNPITADLYSEEPLPLVILYHKNEEIARLPYTYEISFIEKWVYTNIQDSLIKSINFDEFTQILKNKEQRSLIFIGNDKEYKQQFEAVKYLASLEVDIKFYVHDDWKLSVEHGISYPGILMTKPDPPYIGKFSNELLNIENLKYFIAINSFDTIGASSTSSHLPFSKYNFPYIFLVGGPHIYNYDKIKAIFVAVGQQVSDSVKFAILDHTDEEKDYLLDILGVYDKDSGPYIIAYQGTKSRKADRYIMKTPETLIDHYIFGHFDFQLNEFSRRFLKGTLPPYYRVEPEGKITDEYKLTGGTLESFLKQSKYMRAIMYYDSTSKATEGLLIDFISIANATKSDSIRFGYIDINKNDIDHILGFIDDKSKGAQSNTDKSIYDIVGEASFMIVIETETQNKSKKIKDYKQIPYLGSISDPIELQRYFSHYLNEYEQKSLDHDTFDGITSDL